MGADAARFAEEDPQLSLLLASEAWSRSPGVESLGALQQALMGAGPFLGFLDAERSYDHLVFQDDGSLVAISGLEAWRFDLSSGRRTLITTLPAEPLQMLPGGRALYLAGETATEFGRARFLREGAARARGGARWVLGDG